MTFLATSRLISKTSIKNHDIIGSSRLISKTIILNQASIILNHAS